MGFCFAELPLEVADLAEVDLFDVVEVERFLEDCLEAERSFWEWLCRSENFDEGLPLEALVLVLEIPLGFLWTLVDNHRVFNLFLSQIIEFRNYLFG